MTIAAIVALNVGLLRRRDLLGYAPHGPVNVFPASTRDR